MTHLAPIVVLASAALLFVAAAHWMRLAERDQPTMDFGSLLVTVAAFGALVCLPIVVWIKIPLYIVIMLSARPRRRARMPDAAIQAGGGILTLLIYAIVGVA